MIMTKNIVQRTNKIKMKGSASVYSRVIASLNVPKSPNSKLYIILVT